MNEEYFGNFFFFFFTDEGSGTNYSPKHVKSLPPPTYILVSQTFA